MVKHIDRNKLRKKRSYRIKSKIRGSSEIPRMTVYRGANLYVQLIDDEKGITLVSSSTIDKKLKKKDLKANIESAKIVGKDIASKALKLGIKKVVFDRNGYIYTGVIAQLADTARENGLEF